MKSFKFFLAGALILFFLFCFWRPILKFLTDLKTLVYGFSDRAADCEGFGELRLEREKLLYEIENLRRLNSSQKFDYKEAEVFLRYPWNDRSLFIIGLGTEQGVKEGMPVLATEGVLLGIVKSAKRTQSEVLTIFDPAWRSAVAIGESRTKALLRGGAEPVLELIPKESKIIKGDGVFNLSPEFPINYRLGGIDEFQESPKDIWLSADLNVPYNLDALDRVIVLTNFP